MNIIANHVTSIWIEIKYWRDDQRVDGDENDEREETKGWGAWRGKRGVVVKSNDQRILHIFECDSSQRGGSVWKCVNCGIEVA